jgi:hypothetical protein
MCRINLPEGEFPRLGESQPSASKLLKASIRELSHFFAKIEALSIMRNQQHSVFALPKELQDGLATVAIKIVGGLIEILFPGRRFGEELRHDRKAQPASARRCVQRDQECPL